MTSLKRKVEDGNNRSNSKRAKVSDSNATRTTGEEFFHGLVIFIFPVGIQKARLQLFRSQVEKYGGCLKDSLKNDVTHIVVDEAMTIERMCKILKRDTPPCDKTVVKSTWLSACFRQRALVSTADYQFTTPCTVPAKSKDVDNSQKSNIESGNQKKPETNKEPEPSSSELKFPKVGVMWNAFRSKPKGEESEDADSDYVPSDDEGVDSGCAVVTDAASTSSTDTTPNTSPEKIMPVRKISE